MGLRDMDPRKQLLLCLRSSELTRQSSHYSQQRVNTRVITQMSQHKCLTSLNALFLALDLHTLYEI
jgi:hypothetical protein